MQGVGDKFGLRKRNENGNRLIQLCKEMKYVTNTFFQLHPRNKNFTSTLKKTFNE